MEPGPALHVHQTATHQSVNPVNKELYIEDKDNGTGHIIV